VSPGALQELAAALRAEGSPISPHVSDPGSDGAAGEYAQLFESIREGYLLHYDRPRLLAGHDEDLALLAGDYLYALGLARLAELGDDRAVALLADLISRCAQLHTEGRGAEAERLWDEAAGALGLR
jgi:hypothetical protein